MVFLRATYRIAHCIALLVATHLVACNIIDDPLPTYDQTSIIAVGDRAPEFSIESLDGNMLTIPNGETTLLILFSHTCPDCKGLFDELQTCILEGDDTPRIVAVSRGGSSEEISDFRATNNYSFDMAADSDKHIFYQYATMYVPRCYIIDTDGVVQYVTCEYTSGDIDRIMNFIYQAN
jgi:peroxiredoxin